MAQASHPTATYFHCVPATTPALTVAVCPRVCLAVKALFPDARALGWLYTEKSDTIMINGDQNDLLGTHERTYHFGMLDGHHVWLTPLGTAKEFFAVSGDGVGGWAQGNPACHVALQSGPGGEPLWQSLDVQLGRHTWVPADRRCPIGKGSVFMVETNIV